MNSIRRSYSHGVIINPARLTSAGAAVGRGAGAAATEPTAAAAMKDAAMNFMMRLVLSGSEGELGLGKGDEFEYGGGSERRSCALPPVLLSSLSDQHRMTAPVSLLQSLTVCCDSLRGWVLIGLSIRYRTCHALPSRWEVRQSEAR